MVSSFQDTDEYAALATPQRKLLLSLPQRKRRDNTTPELRSRCVCAAHTFIELLRWTNASVKALKNTIKLYLLTHQHFTYQRQKVPVCLGVKGWILRVNL